MVAIVSVSVSVSVEQYRRCVEGVLAVATPDVWIGLGGWCLLGLQQYRYLLPEFHRTLRVVIPLIAGAGIKHVHLYGVLWERALAKRGATAHFAPFAWMCHHYGLTCSTDSKQPITACRSTSQVQRHKAGARKPYWRDNVEYWRNLLINISQSPHYAYPEMGLTWLESPLGKHLMK